MVQLEVVVSCVKVMQVVVDIFVMVKCCIGIDDMDEDEDFVCFIDIVVDVGCDIFIVYVRKVWLQGLSLKENCEILLLNYLWVYRFKQVCFELFISINGGVKMLEEIQ